MYMLWIWVSITVITAITEFVTVQMVSIWFTAGALASIIAYAAGAPYWAQIVIFVVVSLILLLSFRKIAMKWLLRNVKEHSTNSDAIIGTVVKLIDEITPDNPGSAKVGDIVWTVVGLNGFTAAAEEHVKVVEIEGNKLVVTSVEQNNH